MVFGFGRRKSVSKADAKKSVEKSESLPDRIPTPPPEEPFKKKEGPGKNDLAKLANDSSNVFNKHELGRLKGRFLRLADEETGFVDKAEFCAQVRDGLCYKSCLITPKLNPRRFFAA